MAADTMISRGHGTTHEYTGFNAAVRSLAALALPEPDVATSVRRGGWLVPALHAAVDGGLPDAHDDPQRFDLGAWARRLAALRAALLRSFLQAGASRSNRAGPDALGRAALVRRLHVVHHRARDCGRGRRTDGRGDAGRPAT